MVHNGIEYGLMQLTTEIYNLLKTVGGFTNPELHQVFSKWNQGRLQSFLIEITSEILAHKDDLTDGDLVDVILDKAKQKGTGKWTSQNAMDLGIPIPSIDVAVSMREISAMKEERVTADSLYERPKMESMDKEQLEETAEEALYFAFLVTYAQGFHQLYEASEEYGYGLDLSMVAKIWRAGCIIRAALLEDIAMVFRKNNALANFMLDGHFVEKIQATQGSARKLAILALKNGVPSPGLTNSLTYFDALTSRRLPLNLLQAQRDYFGSHTYERTDREGIFHTDWEKLKWF